MSEFPRPADERFDRLSSSIPERSEYEPEAYIESYFISPQGRKEMEDLIYEIDCAIRSSEKGVAGEVDRLLQQPETDLGRCVALLLSVVGVEELSSPRYGQAFRENPAMTICRRLIDRAQHDGADEMATLYDRTLTILANITRYQLFDGSYNPESDEWLHRAYRMKYLRGGKHTQFLPRHLELPDYYSREY